MRLAHHVLSFALLGSPLAAQQVVPMYEEPRHHLRLTTETVRVVEVQIPPGDTTLFHRHDTPALYIAIAVAPTNAQHLGGPWGPGRAGDDPGWQAGDVDIDSGYATVPVEHRVTNLGPALFHLLALARTAAAAPPPGPASDDGLPGHVEQRSTWFRSSRVVLAAGDRTGWMVPSRPLVLVQPLGGRADIERAGDTTVPLVTPGSWQYLPAGTRYRLGNPGTAATAIVAVRIE